MYAALDAIHRRLHQVSNCVQRLLSRAQVLVRAWASECLDATHTTRHTGLAEQHEQTDLRCVAHVRSTAELHRKAWNIHDSHDVAVLLTKERHCTARTRFRVRHLLPLYRMRTPDFAIHD